jgi:hypothetical protein
MRNLDEILYNRVTSTFLLVVDLSFKSSRINNMPLRIESTGRYTTGNHKQAKIKVYYCKDKGSWR